MHTNGLDGGGILTTDGCQHATMVNERRQVAVRNTLIIMDCNCCGTTLTVRTEPHDDREAAYMANLIASIKGGG